MNGANDELNVSVKYSYKDQTTVASIHPQRSSIGTAAHLISKEAKTKITNHQLLHTSSDFRTTSTLTANVTSTSSKKYILHRPSQIVVESSAKASSFSLPDGMDGTQSPIQFDTNTSTTMTPDSLSTQTGADFTSSAEAAARRNLFTKNRYMPLSRYKRNLLFRNWSSDNAALDTNNMNQSCPVFHNKTLVVQCDQNQNVSDDVNERLTKVDSVRSCQETTLGDEIEATNAAIINVRF